MFELTAGKDDDGRRLDRILRKALPDLPLSLIHRLLRQKKILVDNKPASLSHRIKQGMVIKIYAPATNTTNQVNNNAVNHKVDTVNHNKSPIPDPRSPIPILWHEAGIIVFNKPVGLSTHGPDSLDSIVSEWLRPALPRSLSFKPGPLNRLDKPTSGAIVFSQTLEGAKQFSKLLRDRKLEKIYLAIVEGRIEDEESWQDTLEHDKNEKKTYIKNNEISRCASEQRAPIPDPRSLIPSLAITTVKPLATNGNYTLIEARIFTGRHHQIRAQAASHGHPLAGDIKYGGKPMPGQSRGGEFFLHAWKIRFIESPDGFPDEIIAPLPEEFKTKITEENLTRRHGG